MIEKKYDENCPEKIIDINVDNYEKIEKQTVYYNENNSLETHRIGFIKQDVLTNEYLKFSETDKEIGIERYAYKSRIPSYLDNENKDVCILPVFSPNGLTGELLRITSNKK
jgi:hypothetical protein